MAAAGRSRFQGWTAAGELRELHSRQLNPLSTTYVPEPAAYRAVGGQKFF